MLAIALAVIALLIAAVVIVLLLAHGKPRTLTVQRAITIAAPPESIHARIADFHRWRTWSAYEGKDPAMQREFGGAERGVGATYAWNGNREVGRGSMRITRDEAPREVEIALHFIAPFEAHNVARFALDPRGDATHVTWRMDGPAPLLTRVMQLFMDLDHMIGRDFEAGLANLKSEVEAERRAGG